MQVPRVLYAFALLFVVMSIYAVLASQLYGQRDAVLFGRFSLALLTVNFLAFLSHFQ